MPTRRVSPKPSRWLYDLIVRVFAFLVRIFFREIKVQGASCVPNEGSVILVAAPHANQFVDSVILMDILLSLNRRVSWLMAEKSFKRPFIGSMATAIGALPVSRAMDVAQPGNGTILLPEPISNPQLLKGIGTNFTSSEFGSGFSLYLPTINGESHKLEIAEIRGPDILILKTAPTSKDAIFQLTGMRDVSEKEIPTFCGAKFKVAPHVDQTTMYETVFNSLRNAGCVGIFPEGGSHDRTSLLPLKAGIAIMALGALAQKAPVSLVPVGLTYYSAHKFRSRAVVEFGDTVSVDPDLVEDFRTGKKRDAIHGLMDAISKSLAAVTLSAPDYDTLMLIQTARRLYLTDLAGNDESSNQALLFKTELNKKLLIGYTKHSSSAEIISLMENLRSYAVSLAAVGLTDHQLTSIATNHTHFPVLFLLPRLLYRAFKFGILAILTLPGLALFTPVFMVTSRISRQKRAEALAASSVKIFGNDVMATWKILVAAGLAPLFYTIYVTVIIFWHNHIHLYGYLDVSRWVMVPSLYVVLSMITYASLVFGEQAMDLWRSLYPLILSLSPWSSHIFETLKEDRRVLVMEVKEMVHRFGWELFPDCEDIKKWKGRGPMSLYARIGPEVDMEDLEGLDGFF
ncbi:hypothetical protein N431DRAFT_426908 [Stipitochalara longipes BDJ]|nr:hypothetical protein N431DRAFT_426908 [Stipitochalara longipes BDJ]